MKSYHTLHMHDIYNFSSDFIHNSLEIFIGANKAPHESFMGDRMNSV